MELHSADWPVFGWTTDLRSAFRSACSRGRPFVLGTLVSVEGASPRPVGTQMVLDGAAAEGYFSGGCLEADVANHADTVLRDGAARHLVYGQGSPWIDIRLLCGGHLDILLERILPDDEALHDLLGMQSRRCRARWTSDGSSRTISEVGRFENPVTWDGTTYSLCYDPAWRLIVVGGDPIALAIARLGELSGFEVTIVRSGGPATPPPFGISDYRRARPRVAIDDMLPDRWTAIVTATHDDELDDEAVVAALRSDAAYVGVLGSARRGASRRQRLLASGMTPTKIASVHAPIGAARCGKAPWEAAVSVIAEIMQCRTDLQSLPRSPSGDASIDGHDLKQNPSKFLMPSTVFPGG